MIDLNFNGVQKVTFEEIEKLKGFTDCVEHYKAYCTNPDLSPEVEFNYDWYRRNAGVLHCFVVTHNSRCVGFGSMLPTYYPHLNKNILVTESLFIEKRYRGKYWIELLNKLKEFARDNNCGGIIIGAGVGTRFEKYMREKFPLVNTLFWVNINV